MKENTIFVDMRSEKTLRRLLLFLLTVGVFGYILINYIGPSIVLIPKRITDTSEWTPEKYHLKGKYLNFKIDDNLSISGYLSHSDKLSKGVVLICHGIGSCKEHQFGKAKWFNQLGYDVLSFDSRAHGESGGEYCTYGYHEKEDIISIIDNLEIEGYDKFFIFGSSLGGGIALQALSIDPRIKAGIILSTFSTLEEVSFDYQKRMTKIPWKWINNLVNEKAGKMAGFRAEDVKPVKACEAITQPVLMIHGEMDKRINPNCAKRNFEALASEIKQLEMIPAGSHNNAWQIGGKELSLKITDFILANF